MTNAHWYKLGIRQALKCSWLPEVGFECHPDEPQPIVTGKVNQPHSPSPSTTSTSTPVQNHRDTRLSFFTYYPTLLISRSLFSLLLLSTSIYFHYPIQLFILSPLSLLLLLLLPSPLSQIIPGMQMALDIVIASHYKLMKDVPIVGWDVTFTPHGIFLLEVNLSCNFFRGSFDYPEYIAFVDAYWEQLDRLEQAKKNN